MSEAMTIPPLEEAPAKRVPTVYFIDDSATMREVIKIAFRRENIQVITCADAASALRQFEQTRFAARSKKIPISAAPLFCSCPAWLTRASPTKPSRLKPTN